MFAGKKSAQIREILISESAWEEMTCLFAPSLEKSLRKKHRFMHEMMHVWQTQKGMFVRTRGLFSGIADYSYSLDKADLLHYGLEQQASIVSDYWLLKFHGLTNNEHLFEYRDFNRNETIYYFLLKYQEILRGFPG